jgi:hypothetical protein
MSEIAGKPTFAGACADGEVAPIPAVQRQSGNLFGTRGGWTSPPPPSSSLQASDFNRSRASFFSKCELAHTSQKFICILSTPSGSAKKWRPAVESKTKWINSSGSQTVEESTLGYYVDLRFVGIEWG